MREHSSNSTFTYEVNPEQVNTCESLLNVFDGAKFKRTVRNERKQEDIWVECKVEGNVITMKEAYSIGSQQKVKR